MKYAFFQENLFNFNGNAAIEIGDPMAAQGIVLNGDHLVFGGDVVLLPAFKVLVDVVGNGALGANAVIFAGDIGIGGVGKIAQVQPPHPITDGVLQLINNPSTTSLDLSGVAISDHDLPVIYQNLSNNQNISFVDFSNNPLITAHSVVNLYNNHHHGLVSADFTGCGIDLPRFGHLAESSIYQSPLVSCRFGAVNLLSVKAEAATPILSTLHSFLGPKSSFNINNPEHRESLIHFFKSPKAQKALKWLSENSQEVDLIFKGDVFARALDSLRDYNLFHLKGVCKTISDKESCLIPDDALPNILSYLSFDDILRSPAPVIEEVVLVGDDIALAGGE